MPSFTPLPEKIKNPPRLTIGFDGIIRVTDGVRSWPASALALALLPLPTHRVVGFREEVANG